MPLALDQITVSQKKKGFVSPMDLFKMMEKNTEKVKILSLLIYLATLQ